MTDLFLFRNDLRIEDNPGLELHSGAEALLCVYVMEPPRPWCNTLGAGCQRQRFLRESLRALQGQLRRLGQDLLLVSGELLPTLQRLVRRHRVQRIGVADSPGFYENQNLAAMQRLLDASVLRHTGNTLFESSALRALMPKVPIHYTPFRELVESLEPLPCAAAASLPPPPPGLSAERIEEEAVRPHPAFIVRGGHAHGQQRLNAWLFRERAIDHYRETRNQLEGLYISSGLSPWLANGCLSVRAVAAALRRYEASYGSSESSLHLWRELLWREFFHWRAYHDGGQLFRRRGIRGRHKLNTFEPRSFAQWSAGSTDYPLVNALMHQLVDTGWMSNRGRQIAASCLVNEMGVDWRYGAAFFEKHLVDYDVASNYGNWQYIAGVGTDPRGGRHFNLDKQAAMYDPEGEFTARWRGHCARLPRHAVDAADWPIDHSGDTPG